MINHAPGVDKAKYKLHPRTLLLTGLDYAILRRPFFENLKIKNSSKEVAFISLGGSDYNHYSAKLVKLLLELSAFDELHILCSTLFDEQLVAQLQKFQELSNKIFLHFNLGATQVADVMNQCTDAFVSSSSVLIESYSRGLKCFAGYYTRNQQFLYQGFIKNNFAQALGDFRDLNAESMRKVFANREVIQQLRSPLTSNTNILKVFNVLGKP